MSELTTDDKDVLARALSDDELARRLQAGSSVESLTHQERLQLCQSLTDVLVARGFTDSWDASSLGKTLEHLIDVLNPLGA